MGIVDICNSLEFNNYTIIAYEICPICLFQWIAVIVYLKFFFPFIGNAAFLELYFQCLLIYRFQKTVSQLFIYFKSSACNGITLVFIDYSHFVSFVFGNLYNCCMSLSFL